MKRRSLEEWAYYVLLPINSCLIDYFSITNNE